MESKNTNNSSVGSTNNVGATQQYDDTMQRMQKSTQTLQQTLKMAKETEQIGADIMSELEKQGEQLEKVSDNLTTVDNNVAQSNRLLRKMEKKWYDPRSWF